MAISSPQQASYYYTVGVDQWSTIGLFGPMVIGYCQLCLGRRPQVLNDPITDYL